MSRDVFGSRFIVLYGRVIKAKLSCVATASESSGVWLELP